MKHFRVYVSVYSKSAQDYIDDFYLKTPLLTTKEEVSEWVDNHTQEIIEKAEITEDISALDYFVDIYEGKEYLDTDFGGCVWESDDKHLSL